MFVTVLDIEQVFVIDCRHGERVFGQREGGTVVAVWAEEPVEPSGSFLGGRPGPRLRLVDGAGAAGHPVDALRGYGQGMGLPPEQAAAPVGGAGGGRVRPVARAAGCRRVSAKVRRRRLAAAGVAAIVVTLALLPHPRPVSAPAALPGGGAGTTYVVRPGDTLWTIATRVDPTGDPRPLVARLHAETGTYMIVPGERIRIP